MAATPQAPAAPSPPTPNPFAPFSGMFGSGDVTANQGGVVPTDGISGPIAPPPPEQAPQNPDPGVIFNPSVITEPSPYGVGTPNIGFGGAPAFGQTAGGGLGGGISGAFNPYQVFPEGNPSNPFATAFRRVRAASAGPGSSGIGDAQPAPMPGVVPSFMTARQTGRRY